ncbi:NAD(P)H-dependent oxidoreductase [Ensifer adhaerens]|uniref:CE1759 family FMN reductase n=1 Tax=Ensifer adhaerens TaxID=106592 RepID=UPI001CBC29B8|nr:CE1759 family FMN reductase [Ensifer adhaerens]MBZ7921478.1 NAD(P)H-dependent oxidoreductase [Ensifer adhaerens]UAX93903.1 NAD(P)H-dependent oxidoreductase [Ensifer adhaerens]UAY01538.1 NAD(P)H-dependent oxidoreductase [Ensifer adhaerens]UAY08921.1 NAD(P)H-dependent oxidoreductase [Ensifer adhaerens]
MTNKSLVVISAGLRQPSSTRLLADQLAAAVRANANDIASNLEVETIELRDTAHDVVNNLLVGYPSPSLDAVIQKVTEASGLIIASPVFAASVSGMFKSFFDVIEKDALAGKPILLAATGGTPRHALVLENVIRPIFIYLRATVVPTAVFAATEDFGGASSGGALSERVDRAARELAQAMKIYVSQKAEAPSEGTTSFDLHLAAGSRDAHLPG